jgi:hypothetical protein
MANSPYLPSAGVDTHHPLLATDDDDDQVFCVVCDGECTCPSASRTAVLLDSTPSAYSPRVSSPVPTSNSASRASLKIKLPAGLLSKARASTSTTHVRSDGTAKRLGRPLKPDVRKAKSSLIKLSNKPGRPPRPPLAKKSAALKKKRKNRAAVPWEESDSDLTDLDAAMLDALEGEEAGFLAPAPTHLPTFLPASAVQSSLAAANSTDSDSDSSSDSSSTAGFGTDVSMEAEEEDFIIGTSSRHKDRTRVPPRKEVHNKWEIKPRLRSVSMEAEMEVDSGEETEADDDDEDEEEVTQDGAGGETTDADAWGGTQGPVATTWSDGEESDLDVEVFFAGLGSGSSSSSSDEEDVPAEDNLPVAPTPRSPTSLFSFEHTQSWDVDTMFSSMDGLPTFMDADLACFYDPVEESSMSEAQDATMSPSDGYEREDEDDGEDNAWSDDDGGVTTDEDLVDAVGLPTPRAMALFQMPITPASLASVAPLATVSPYVGTVIRNGQPRPPARPADILAGRAPYMHDHTSDEHDDDDPVTRRARSASWSTSRGGKLYPRMGRFDCTPGGSSSVRQAVIDGQTPQIQSPFPRRARSLRRSEVRTNFVIVMQLTHILYRLLAVLCVLPPAAQEVHRSAVYPSLGHPSISMTPWVWGWIRRSPSTYLCSPIPFPSSRWLHQLNSRTCSIHPSSVTTTPKLKSLPQVSWAHLVDPSIFRAGTICR